ncbi:MAG: PIG-L family deacetylase [Candidatus Omnitrophica bacterium]|nr:PIG-L family deacetylase [Candidatus Omnitrophota bacterium]
MNILAIGAHPDDIEFGCGGTLIKYARAGHNVDLFIATDGSFGGEPGTRRKEQQESAKSMGAREVFWGDFIDTEVTSSRQLIWKIDGVVQKVKPDIVFLNYHEDIHQDHRGVALAAISATRYVHEVLFFEVPTTYNFDPATFVDIEDVLDKKLHLLELHNSQIDKTRVRNLTILESAKSCATFRGFQGRVKYAEGFRSLRVLRKIS